MTFSNKLKDPYQPYFDGINELFKKYKRFYTSKFISTHADAHYTLDGDGNALFTFNLKIEKSNDSTVHNNNFYVAIPIIKSFNGKCIENGERSQKIHALNVECKDENISLDAKEIQPKTTNIQVNTVYNNPNGKSLQLEMWVIEIPFKLDNGSSEAFNLEVSFQVKNFAVEINHRIFKEVIGKKKFVILWYFGFETGASSSQNRTAKIEIEHPERGQLKIQPENDRIKVNNELGYAKHGRKFICGLHANNNATTTTNDKSSMHCFFEYSYMPEWAVILLSVIVYHFFVVIFDIIREFCRHESYPLSVSTIFFVLKEVFYPEILFLIVITLGVGFVLSRHLIKNCT